MEDAELVPVRDRGVDEVDGWQAVVRGAGELGLGVSGAAFEPPGLSCVREGYGPRGARSG